MLPLRLIFIIEVRGKHRELYCAKFAQLFQRYDWREYRWLCFLFISQRLNAILRPLPPSVSRRFKPAVRRRFLTSYFLFPIVCSFFCVSSLIETVVRPLSPIFRDSRNFLSLKIAASTDVPSFSLPASCVSRSTYFSPTLPPLAPLQAFKQEFPRRASHTFLSKRDINVSGGRKIHERPNDLDRARYLSLPRKMCASFKEAAIGKTRRDPRRKDARKYVCNVRLTTRCRCARGYVDAVTEEEHCVHFRFTTEKHKIRFQLCPEEF